MIDDYLIIGAGSAGCSLAWQLATSRPDKSVTVLEAGGPDRSPLIHIPAGQIRAIARHDWGYRSQPDPTRNGASERWERGRVLGGSSSINGTMYVRGARGDFDRWASRYGGDGSSGWRADDVVPLFSGMETSDQPGPTRGRSGPLSVRTVKRPQAVTKAFVAAALASGYPFNEDYNGEMQEGVSYAQLTQKRGFRSSAATAFLKPLLHRQNLRVLLNSMVERIEIEGNRARSVVLVTNGMRTCRSAREIILCAGTLNSPKLLMLSGIGDRGQLASLGIEPQLDLPGVGKNLRDHPLLKLVYRMRVPTSNPTEGWRQRLRFLAEFALRGEGPIANIFEAAAFLRTSAALSSPDIQLHFLAVGFSAENGEFKFAPYPSVTVMLNKSHPVSHGQLRLISADPAAPPSIEARLLADRADVDTLIDGVGVIRRIMGTAPIAQLVDQEIAPGPSVQNATALEHYVRTYAGIAYHPVGTCRMGTDDDAVVTPDLQVRGVGNLWIADASVIPDLPSGNTNAACMMIGMKLGKHLARQP